MSAQVLPARSFAPVSRAPLVDLARPRAPATAAEIAAVLVHADLVTSVGPGRERRAVSPGRLADVAAQGDLEVSAARLADLAVIWDEAEGAVVRVIDEAGRAERAAPRPAWWESLWDDEFDRRDAEAAQLQAA